MSDQAPEPNAPAATPAPEGAATNPLHDAARAKASRRSGRRGTTPEAPADPAPRAAPDAAPQAAPESADEAPTVDVNELKTKHARVVNQARQYERKYRELETKVKQLEDAGSKPNPLEGDDFEAKVRYAEKHGLTLRALTDYTLQRRGQGAGDEPQATQSNAEIEKLRAEIEEMKASRQKDDEQRQTREAESLRQQELDVIDRHAKSSDKWALISEFGRQQLVYDRFYEIAQKQGFAPRLADVMDEVAEELEGGAKALLRHDKVRSLAKADPELFKELREFFAQEQAGNESQPAETAERRSRGGQRNGARPITQADASQKTTRRERGLPSKAERKRAAVARLKAIQSN